MQEVIDWLTLLVIILLTTIVMGVMGIFILLWTPFLLLGMAFDYYDDRKKV